MNANILSAGGAATLVLVLTALIFTLACGRFMPRQDVSTNTENANANTNANTTTGMDPEKKKALAELLDKKTEFRSLSPPVALVPNAMITGKAVVASSERDLDDRKFLSSARQAASLAELQNIIQINCMRGKYVGEYEWSGSGSKTKGYAVDCKVSLIDYKANKVIAQKSFSNSVVEEIVLSGSRDGDGVLMDKPFREMVAYIESFQYDKVVPSSYVEERELVNAAAQVKLDPNVGLRGEVAIASLIERGPINIAGYTLSQISSSEKYGVPDDRITRKYEELDTLVRIVCRQGAPIGVNEGAKQFASKCDVQVIDFKTMTVVAQKTLENKTIDTKISKDVNKQWLVDHPKEQIEAYLKSLPAS